MEREKERKREATKIQTRDTREYENFAADRNQTNVKTIYRDMF